MPGTTGPPTTSSLVTGVPSPTWSRASSSAWFRASRPARSRSISETSATSGPLGQEVDDVDEVDTAPGAGRLVRGEGDRALHGVVADSHDDGTGVVLVHDGLRWLWGRGPRCRSAVSEPEDQGPEWPGRKSPCWWPGRALRARPCPASGPAGARHEHLGARDRSYRDRRGRPPTGPRRSRSRCRGRTTSPPRRPLRRPRRPRRGPCARPDRRAAARRAAAPSRAAHPARGSPR